MASKAQEVALMRNGDYQFEGSADDPSGPASYPRLTKADLPSSLQSTRLPYTAFFDPRRSPDQRD